MSTEMSKREREELIKALRAEVAELRKELKALAEDLASVRDGGR